jgi:beta-lactamase class A
MGRVAGKRGSRVVVGLGALAVFCAGIVTGRVAGFSERPPPAADTEIREGLHGYTNPLLECEIANERLYSSLRPFGDKLRALVGTLEGDRRIGGIAVYFRDLNNGPWVGHHEKRLFVPASLAKVPIVIACLRFAEVEPAFLDRRIVYEGLGQEREPGFLNPESNLTRGVSYTVDQLILQVAKYSDNSAARLLATALPSRLLQGVYFDLGVDPQRLKSADLALSPKEYGAFFRVLYNASYLSKRFSEKALAYFAQSTFELGLVAGVPDGTPVSHKFGVWEKPPAVSGPSLQLHDCGIVYHPQRPYLLCVMTSGENYVAMTGAIADISRLVYEEVDRDQKRPGGQELPVAPEPEPGVQ